MFVDGNDGLDDMIRFELINGDGDFTASEPSAPPAVLGTDFDVCDCANVVVEELIDEDDRPTRLCFLQ